MTTKPQIKPIKEIIPGIYQLPLPLADKQMPQLSHVNSYLIKETGGWMLIDPGWNSQDTQQALESMLKGMDLGFTDISNLVITHCHPDHYGLAGRIKKLHPEPGC